ncbi:MAG: hypothetical protein K2X66_02400, partial [Cyanobacteria bacterium]|nr:hypothetical protein [Cyanobacteriota bacterium]
LCHGWLRLFGEGDLETLLSQFKSNPHWKMSDGFPYQITDQDAFVFFPKPVAMSSGRKALHSEIDNREAESQEETSGLKKQMKALLFLKAEDIPIFLNGDLDEAKLNTYPESDELWTTQLTPQVSVSRTGEDANPFQVNYLRFANTNTCRSGLWVLFEFPQNFDGKLLQKLKDVVALLGESIGIGGEKSAGAGRFEPEWSDEEDASLDGELNQATRLLEEIQSAGFNPESPRQLLISLANPTPEEARHIHDQAKNQESPLGYQLLNRRGFHYSLAPGWPGPVKKKPVAMLMSGSVLGQSITGRLVEVTPALQDGEAPHSLYRYGFAMTLGV